MVPRVHFALEYPRKDSKNLANTRETSEKLGLSPYPSPYHEPSAEFLELVGLWDSMDESARFDLLSMARSRVGDLEKNLDALGTVPSKPPKPVG